MTKKLLDERSKGSLTLTEKYKTRINLNGTIRDVYVKVTGLDRSNKLMFTLQDITDFIQLGKKLEESENKHKDIVEQSLVGFCTIKEGEFTYFNM